MCLCGVSCWSRITPPHYYHTALQIPHAQPPQLCQLEHALSQPLAALGPAISTGSRARLQAAIAQLPPAAVQSMAVALDEGAAAAPASGRKGSKAAAGAGAGAAAVVEERVWEAAESFGRWRLAVLALHALARSAGEGHFSGVDLVCSCAV